MLLLLRTATPTAPMIAAMTPAPSARSIGMREAGAVCAARRTRVNRPRGRPCTEVAQFPPQPERPGPPSKVNPCGSVSGPPRPRGARAALRHSRHQIHLVRAVAAPPDQHPVCRKIARPAEYLVTG